MKTILVLLAAVLPITLAVAACDDDDGRQACEAFRSKCPAGSTTTTCDAEAINAATNEGEIEDCVQGAADCNAATTCLATLKR